MTASAPSTNPVGGSVVIARQITRVRRRQTGVAVGTGLAQTVMAAVVLLTLAMLVDWRWELAWPARAAVLAAELAGLGWLLGRRVLRPWWNRPDDDAVALWMERAEPELRGRLISAVQLTRPEAQTESPALVRALVAATETVAGQTDFAGYVVTAAFGRALILLWFVVTVAGVGFMVGRPASGDLLMRALLSARPVPRQTRVTAVTGNQIVARGDAVTLTAVATGKIPARGAVTLQFASGRTQTFPLDPLTRGGNRFARVIQNVQESFRYTLRLNDGVSDAFQIEVQARPAVAAMQCEQTFPAYTKLPPTPRPLGDLTLLAGSRLRLTARATKPLRSAEVQLVGPAVETGSVDARHAGKPALPQSLPMTIDTGNPSLLSAVIPIPATGLTGLRLHLVDTVGLPSADEVTYRVDVVPDRPPAINITGPTRQEELVTAVATLVIGFEASDDYGLSQVFLHVRSNDKETTTEFELKTEPLRALRRRYEWRLAEIKPPLAVGTIVEYWLEAKDNNTVTGPGIGVSEHYYARVVTADEKRAELLGRLDDSLRLLLNTAQEQEKLNQDLGELIRGKPGRR